LQVALQLRDVLDGSDTVKGKFPSARPNVPRNFLLPALRRCEWQRHTIAWRRLALRTI